MSRINGQQARELLDGATSGPWEFFHHEWDHDEDGESRFEQWGVTGGSDGIMHREEPRDALFNADNGLVDEHDHAANLRLAAAAPALAETVAWLYGQTGQDQWGDWELDHHDPYYQFAAVRPDGEGRISLAVGPYGQEIRLDPDEAVEVARALLTAAEEARP